VRVLLKFGVDPNLPDEFSNIYLVAREKGLNSLQGMMHFVTLMLCNIVFQVLYVGFFCSAWTVQR